MKKRIKTFSIKSTNNNLSNTINEILEKDNIKLIDIKLSVCDSFEMALVIYEETYDENEINPFKH